MRAAFGSSLPEQHAGLLSAKSLNLLRLKEIYLAGLFNPDGFVVDLSVDKVWQTHRRSVVLIHHKSRVAILECIFFHFPSNEVGH